MQLEKAIGEPAAAAGGFGLADDPQAETATTQLKVAIAILTRLGIHMVVTNDG